MPCSCQQVHVQPLYVFPAPVSLAAIEDVLIEQQPHGDACTTQQQQNGSSRLRYEPVLGSQQHGVLWEAFMRAAKKQQKALALIQEEAQQQQHCGGACANGVNGCS
jgi:hypothetical protein